MGVFAATIGGTVSTPLLSYMVGTTTVPTQPTPLAVFVGAVFRFAEVAVPGTEGVIRVEWLRPEKFDPEQPLQVSLIVGSDPPKEAVLKDGMFVDDEASNEPFITEEMKRLLPTFEGPLTTVFAPSDKVPLDQLLNSPNNEGFLSTVGDSASVGAGIGAVVGLVTAGPAGAAKGAAVGAALGTSFGIGFYIGEQIGEAIS